MTNPRECSTSQASGWGANDAHGYPRPEFSPDSNTVLTFRKSCEYILSQFEDTYTKRETDPSSLIDLVDLVEYFVAYGNALVSHMREQGPLPHGLQCDTTQIKICVDSLSSKLSADGMKPIFEIRDRRPIALRATKLDNDTKAHLDEMLSRSPKPVEDKAVAVPLADPNEILKKLLG